MLLEFWFCVYDGEVMKVYDVHGLHIEKGPSIPPCGNALNIFLIFRHDPSRVWF